MSIAVTEYVDNTHLGESMARRLIAKDLKIVSGTIVIAASSYDVSGEDFDYATYGSRFLWMGLSPRPQEVAGPAASGDNIAYGAVYDPVGKKVHLTVGGGNAALAEIPNGADNEAVTINFTLFVFEGGASAGTGIG